MAWDTHTPIQSRHRDILSSTAPAEIYTLIYTLTHALIHSMHPTHTRLHTPASDALILIHSMSQTTHTDLRPSCLGNPVHRNQQTGTLALRGPLWTLWPCLLRSHWQPPELQAGPGPGVHCQSGPSIPPPPPQCSGSQVADQPLCLALARPTGISCFFHKWKGNWHFALGRPKGH